MEAQNGDDPTSHTSAPNYTATVAPFRAWRSSQRIVAKGPIGSPLNIEVKHTSRAAHYRNLKQVFKQRLKGSYKWLNLGRYIALTLTHKQFAPFVSRL